MSQSIDLSAKTVYIRIDQGSESSIRLTFVDSIVGASFAAQVRPDPVSSEVILTFSGADFVIDEINKTVDWLFTAAKTSAALRTGKFFYDLEKTQGGITTRIMQGDFVLNAEITK